MKTSTTIKSVDSIIYDIDSENVNFKHKLQRLEGQWNREAKSLLIDSLLINIPIDYIYTVTEEENKYAIIDGIQRVTTIYNFVKGNFALSKNIKPVKINNKQFDLAGLKFDDLDAIIQNKIKTSNISFCEITEYTDNEVREMFRRKNSGKALNNRQLRTVKENDQLMDIEFNLSRHDVMNLLMTDANRKSATDRDIIRQTLMLIESDNMKEEGVPGSENISFSSKNIDDFIIWYNNNINKKNIKVLESAMNKLNSGFVKVYDIKENNEIEPIETIEDEQDKEDQIKAPKKRGRKKSNENNIIKVNITSIPMILYGAYKVTKDKKNFGKYMDKVKEFIDNYESNEQYKTFSVKHTTSSENVNGRLNYFKEIVKEI